jgi:DNA-3-methyladenine glycosylase
MIPPHIHTKGQPLVMLQCLDHPERCIYTVLMGFTYCINIVSGPEGVGEGILLRAARVCSGEAELSKRLARPIVQGDLIDGPGLLGRALAVDLPMNGISVLNNNAPLRLAKPTAGPRSNRALPRIGISRNSEALLRFRSD